MNQLAQLPQNEVQTTPNGDIIDPNLGTAGGLDVWGILSRRKWLVILGCVLGLGLGYIYLLQAPPVYESLAQVLIEERKPPMFSLADINTQFSAESDEAKHAHMISSPTQLYRAYENFGIKKLANYSDATEAMGEISKNLQVNLVEQGTNILSISFRGPNPDDTQTVVTSILDAYEAFLRENYEDTGKETRDMFQNAQQDLLEKIQTLTDEYRDFKTQNALLYDGNNPINLHQSRQLQYEQKRVVLREQMAELEAQIQEIEAELKRTDGNLEAIVLRAEKDGHRLGGNELTHTAAQRADRYLMLKLQEKDMTRRYADDHPDVLSIRGQIQEFEAMFPEVTEGRVAKKSDEEILDFVTNYVTSLKQRLAELSGQVANLDRFFNEEEEAAKTLQGLQVKDQIYRDEIARMQQLFDAVVKSLEGVDFTRGYEGVNYQLLANPGPGNKVAPLAYQVMPIAALAGSLAGFGLAYLVDIADKAFRTPDEVSQIMRLPVVGHIPLIDIAKQKTLPGCNIQPVICTVHRPKSPQSESYRAVRTALYFNNKDKKHQIIQLTSPMPGDGKSTLAANLAVTMAQSGKKVLIMDADFRRPTLHKVFGVEKLDIGLATVVSGETDPVDAMQTVPEAPNLRIMACGARPTNPSELLSSEQFAQVLDVLREQFDFVLIDTPPILAVSDPCAVAARADGVILTFRIHKRARPLAVRARDALLNIGANVIGVVVNGVDQEAGGYYSQYRYGYTGYRYAYNYRQTYGYGAYGSEKSETTAIKKYFDDDGTRKANTENTDSISS